MTVIRQPNITKYMSVSVRPHNRINGPHKKTKTRSKVHESEDAHFVSAHTFIIKCETYIKSKQVLGMLCGSNIRHTKKPKGIG